MNYQAHRSIRRSIPVCLLIATGALLLCAVPSALAASRPVIDRELAEEVGVSEAKLGALISPGALDTSYYFEYGTTTAYGQSTPYPVGDAGAGATPSTVWAAASGLQPGVTYHYRVIASNEVATVKGSDQTFTTETAEQAACPNEQLRTGFSAGLPDCRAYEQVTVPNEASSQPDIAHERSEINRNNAAARDGNRFSYYTTDVLPGSQSGDVLYLATRGAGGWSSEDVVPPTDYYGFGCEVIGEDVSVEGYSADMSRELLSDGESQVEGASRGGGGECNGPDPELVSGEPLGVMNLFVRDNEDAAYQLVDLVPPGVAPANANPLGASEDDSHVVFGEHAQLTLDAPGGVEDVYEWNGGVVRLVTVLPNGTPAVGSLASTRPEAHAVSADGSRVVFSAGGGLYLRENAEQPPSEECAGPTKACTVQLDASQAGGSGGGQFQAASTDGSRVLFTDERQLTAGSSAAAGEPDLYEYDASTAKLTDLSAAASGHAHVQGVVGISEDAAYVYFAALGVLAGNANAHGERATAGQLNIYLRHEGATTFIAGADPATEVCLDASEPCSRVSANGLYLALTSTRSLTGYDNFNTTTGRLDHEIFLYSAASGRFVCASCSPSGEAPTGAIVIEDGQHHPTNQSQSEALLENNGGLGVPHYLSDSGRLFFETVAALLPRDTNGQFDVYEFEPDGVGSCGEVAGCLALVSSGTSSLETMLLDASANGNDVFMREFQQLTPEDKQEGSISIVDARVDGGFPQAVSPPPCATADSCRAAASAQPPIFGAPASQTFSGAGNLAPAPVAAVKPKAKAKSKPVRCSKGLVAKRGRCVKAKAGKRRARKSAHTNRKAK